MGNAADLKSVERKFLWVRVPPWAPIYRRVVLMVSTAVSKTASLGSNPSFPASRNASGQRIRAGSEPISACENSSAVGGEKSD